MMRFLLEIAAFFSAVLILIFGLVVFALAVTPPYSGLFHEIVNTFNTGDWE